MKVAIVGAGAVGCYFGGLLARAGHDVTFIGRAAHADAIQRDGLLFEMRDFKAHVPAKGSTDPAAVRGADLVMIAVKSTDSEAAGRSIAASLSPDAAVLSLQNGVDNAERLAAVLGRPVIPTVVYVGTEMAGPGHVRHHGRGELVIGAAQRSRELAEVLARAGIVTTVSDDIARAQWAKLVTNCAYNPLSAVAQISYGPMLAVEGCEAVITEVVRECNAVARACGVTLPEDLLDQVLGLARSMPAQSSSTAQDLARGKPTEIDFLNGYVVRKGAELGIPTPANLALLVMVRLAEKSGLAARASA